MAESINATVLFNEAKVIQQTGSKPVFFAIEATIHVRGKDIPILTVDHVDTIRNYKKDRFETLTLGLRMGRGTYETNIVPYKENVEITLRYIPLGDKSVNEDLRRAPKAMRYRAILINGGSSTLEGNSLGSNNPAALDKVDVANVEFQLVDPVVERLRLFTFGGIVRATSILDAIRTILGGVSKNASKDAAVGFKGVDVAETVNTKVRNHIVLEHGTPFVNVLDIIQDRADGIFNAGLGWFYQKGIWYVFPPYDTKRFSKAKRTVTVINIPANRLPNPEKSYRINGNSIVLLSTSEVMHRDNSEEALLNEGNGVRFADANKFMQGRVEVKDNKATFNKSTNTSAFVFERRESGTDLVQEASTRIVGNVNGEFSKIAARNGGLLQMTWENANIDLLTPGMPAKILYMEQDVPKEVTGVLIGVDAQTVSVTPGSGEKSYRTTAAITFFIHRVKK